MKMPFIKNDKLLRKKILNFFWKIKIKYLNLTFSKILILVWILVVLISLSMPWFSLPYNSVDSQNAFSSVLWLNWMLIIFVSIFNIFIIFSSWLKKKIKLFLDLSLNEKNLLLYSSLILLLIIINSVLIIKWLILFSNEIIFYSWSSMWITGSIIMVIWWYLNKIKNTDEYTKFIWINESHSEENINKKDKSIKLPF